MISRSSFVSAIVARELCKEIAVSRNTRRIRDSDCCRRRGRSTGFPSFFPHSRAFKSIPIFFFPFLFLSLSFLFLLLLLLLLRLLLLLFFSYIYLPIYLDSFPCAWVARTIAHARGSTRVRVRRFYIYNYISVYRAGRRIDALSTCSPIEHKSVKSFSSFLSRRVVSFFLTYTNSRWRSPANRFSGGGGRLLVFSSSSSFFFFFFFFFLESLHD